MKKCLILKMCKGHVEEKSLLYVCEIHDYHNIDEVTYVVNLYKRYEETPLLKKEQNIYRRHEITCDK